MAEIHGKGGQVKSGANKVASIDTWSLSVDAEMADISEYGDDDRAFLPGLRNATGSISGSYHSTDVYQNAITNQFSSTGTISALTLHLMTSTSTGFTGSAYLTNLSINSDISDKVGFSANVQFSGGVHRSTI